MTRKKTGDLSDMLAAKGDAAPAIPAAPAQKTDGRALRKSGRIQLGLKVMPDARDMLLRLAQEEGRTMGEVFERALALYADQPRKVKDR